MTDFYTRIFKAAFDTVFKSKLEEETKQRDVAVKQYRKECKEKGVELVPQTMSDTEIDAMTDGTNPYAFYFLLAPTGDALDEKWYLYKIRLNENYSWSNGKPYTISFYHQYPLGSGVHDFTLLCREKGINNTASNYSVLFRVDCDTEEQMTQRYNTLRDIALHQPDGRLVTPLPITVKTDDEALALMHFTIHPLDK